MRLRPAAGALAVILAGAFLPTLTFPAHAADAAKPLQAADAAKPAPTTLRLANGAEVTYDAAGTGTLTSPDGKTTRTFPVSKASGQSAFGPVGQPDQAGVVRRATAQSQQSYASDEVVVGLSATVTGGAVGNARARFHVPAARAAVTSDATVNAALAKVHGDALWPAAAGGPAGTYVVHLAGGDPVAAARSLAGTAGVAFAQPNAYVATMNTGARPLPAGAAKAVAAAGTDQPRHPATLSQTPQASGSAATGNAASPATTAGSGLPANWGVTTSLQSYLNAGGVDAMGTFADDARYLKQLPGTGQIITNVSLGDLTDAGMAADGDSYVQEYGPDSIVSGGQRYLDYPSLPLIPTYAADASGTLEPTGSVEGEDPYLGEVLLDFSMMAPLPHDQQRAGAQGDGLTDLLGIAPGAKYRLVIPQEPTEADLAGAFVAAAHQTPKPNVITASIGWAGDAIGYPGRYLEDDPLMHTVIQQIVKMGIAVVISSNDGTRLGLPVSVGPDGGSVPTDLAGKGTPTTSFADDEPTTTPTEVTDSGAVVAGASTLDDTLAAPGGTAEYPTTRYDGATSYSSGFGSRVDLAAPGDNLPSLIHECPGACPDAQAVEVVLNGGTSASAPMIAAAMADVLQAAKATGQSLSPQQVREILVKTGRRLAQTPQTDQVLNMGPELDVTAAVESVLSKKFALGTSAVRLSVAQRQEIGSLGAEFEEDVDPSNISLSAQDVVAPLTFGLDMTGTSRGDLRYRLLIGGREVTESDSPSVRLTPAQVFAALGQPLTSTAARTVPVSFQAVRGTAVVASGSQNLTFGATDGTYPEALAPTAPGSVPLGQPVTVHYDLTGVTGVDSPQLVLSSVGHWTPNGGGDLFRVQYSVPLTATRGSVTIPASAFTAGGGGLYGVGIIQQTVGGWQGPQPFYGQFRGIRVGGDAAGRPVGPTLGRGAQAGSHAMEVQHSDPMLPVRWDARAVGGATGAALEFSAPGPTLYGSLNTFTNANGSGRDDNGVDNGSPLMVDLPGKAGSTSLDLAKLGLPDSTQFSVRVFATKNGRPIGQASPTAFVQYDDSQLLAPETIQNFDVTGGSATMSVASFGPGDDGPYSLTDTALVPVNLKTGVIGTRYADYTDGAALDNVVGVDSALRRTVMATVPYASGSPEIKVYDSGSGALVDDVTIPHTGDVYMLGAKLDPRRHRAFESTYDPNKGVSQLWWLDLSTGKLSGPLQLNDATIMNRSFDDLEIDESTGDVFASPTGTQGPCLIGYAAYAVVRVSPDAGTVSPATHEPVCTASLAADGKGGSLYVVTGAAQPNPEGGDFPTSDWRTLDQKTLATIQGPSNLGARGPAWAVLDATHGVALVAHLYEDRIDVDNNAMSEIDTVDPSTGQVLHRAYDVNLTNSTEAVTNFNFTSNRGLQIDPATRTAWVVAPYANELQRFTY